LAFLSARTAYGYVIFGSLAGDYDAQVTQGGLGVSAMAGFVPSPLDGKEFRDQFAAKMTERITSGVSESTLRGFADSKLFKTEKKHVIRNASQNLVAANSTERYLPFFQEERSLWEQVWTAYKLGEVSPKVTSGAKSADTAINTLDFVNFIGLQGDQQFPDYIVSQDGTAFYTRGTVAKKLIQALNETQNTVGAINARAKVVTEEDKAVFDAKIVDVVGNYMQILTKMDDHYQSLDDVLFQVRICLLSDLIGTYKLAPTESMTLKQYDYEGGQFSTANCAGKEADSTTKAERAKLEEQFKTMASDYLNYVKKEASFLTVNNVEQVLSAIGLPGEPSAAEDPATTLERVFKSQDSLPFNLISIDYAVGDAKNHKNPYLNSLEYGTILKAIEIIKPTKGPNAGKTLSVQIPDAVAKARAAYFDELKADEPYLTLLNDKADLLTNMIFSSGREMDILSNLLNELQYKQ